MRRSSLILAALGVIAALLSLSFTVAGEKGPPGGPEFKAVTFGTDESANIERLTELATDGWEYVGPLNPGTIAFRKVVPKTVVGDAAKLSGVWINVFTEQDGIRDTPDSRHVFVGNRYFVIDGDTVTEDGTFVIDTAGPVKKIDYKCVRGDDAGHTWRGVYELDGNTFRHFGPWGINNWHKRPATLAAKTDATTFLRVMRREAP
jgi:uncharacterized protein (TIGR03067 family)